MQQPSCATGNQDWYQWVREHLYKGGRHALGGPPWTLISQTNKAALTFSRAYLLVKPIGAATHLLNSQAHLRGMKEESQSAKNCDGVHPRFIIARVDGNC